MRSRRPRASRHRLRVAGRRAGTSTRVVRRPLTAARLVRNPPRRSGIEAWSNLTDLEGAARARLPVDVWDYISGGACEERTLADNVEAFRHWAIRPHVLTGASAIDLSTTLLGADVPVPFFAAPTAYLGGIHPSGEAAVARAAGTRGILAAFSTLSSRSIEEIAAASGAGPRWFQLYRQAAPDVSRRLVERAEAAGYRAIVLTADAPVLGVRDRQARKGFGIDPTPPLGNGRDVRSPPRTLAPEAGTFRVPGESSAGFEAIDEIRSWTRLPVLVKGILTAEDARRAREHGASGVVVSNHGGRQLDGAIAALDALPEVVREVGERVEVYLDGGVRRASDILIALAQGARAVGIGRPILWALAVGGAEGVGRYLDLLTRELVTAMAICGRARISEVDATLVVERPPLRSGGGSARTG